MTDHIFQSVGQALHVSFLMAILPVTQRVSTQVLIDSLRTREDALRSLERRNEITQAVIPSTCGNGRGRRRVEVSPWPG